MRFLATEHEITHESASDELLRAEAAEVWRLHKAGKIRELYFKKETREAVIILECENRQEVQDCLSALPLVEGAYIRFEINELVPYDGYERLFC